MKRIMLLLGVLVLGAIVAGQLRAEDNPFLGTWKLNAAKSKAEGTTVPKSMTRTVTAAGDKVTYSFEGVGADGSALKFSFTVVYDGKDYPVTGTGMPGGADSISIKRLSTNKFAAVLKKGGKQIATSTAEASKDGKTATIAAKGTSADGKPTTSTMVYDKQ